MSRMRKTLLLLLTCSGFFVLSINMKAYHYVKSPKTWAEAQEYCRDVYADLATIDSQAGNDRLLHEIQDPGEHAWIGLYDNLVRLKWTLDDAEFNNDKDFSNWKTGHPSFKYSNESCVVLSRLGVWRDELCRNHHPAVCFYERGSSKYILLETKMPWKEALDYCRSNYTDLARVTNVAENLEIHSLLNRGYWIGLHRNLWSNWSDRSPVTFTNWNKNQPKNGRGNMTSCAAVDTTTGKWFDDDSEKKQKFICQTLPSRRNRFKLKFQSDADLSDPNIQQQILKQLHAKLEARGLTDFKLRWTEADGQTFLKEQSTRKQGSGK